MVKHEQRRQAKWRMDIFRHAAEVTGNVSKTCRYYGISRKTFYKWRARYEAHGEAGLCDRSSAPSSHPQTTPSEVISKILYLRQHYHFGPARISLYLARYHQVSASHASVHRILRRHGMSRLPSSQKHRPRAQRYKRYEKQQPGHRVQMDVKFLERIPGSRRKLYQFTAIDDCTRLRILKIYDACNQKTAIQFIADVLRRLPFRIHTLQTDNGAEFQSAFHWYVEDLGIRHVYIKPRTPRLNGKVERSHRVDDQEFYQLLDRDGVGDDIHLFNDKLKAWETFYNYQRPHGALSGQTPYERLLQKLKPAMSPA